MKPYKSGIRFILADVDGTLVTQDKVLTAKTKEAVAKLGNRNRLLHCKRATTAWHANRDQGLQPFDRSCRFQWRRLCDPKAGSDCAARSTERCRRSFH